MIFGIWLFPEAILAAGVVSVCADRGFPHEAIEIHKINGRLRNDGTYDVQGHEVRDHYTGRPHQHKQRYLLGSNMQGMLK